MVDRREKFRKNFTLSAKHHTIKEVREFYRIFINECHLLLNMVHGRQIISYALDLLHGVKQYPCGWLKPAVVKGYFNDNDIGKYQELFFDQLLHLGFERTYWQLVFPNQTAGLVKKIPPTTEGVDEYHIRFYSDGVIDCELEVNRFNGWHWVGPRKHGVDLLENILDNEINNLSTEDKAKIRTQFGVKPYSDSCVRR